jgi:3-isopropylmalate/(R)-2-methylmalate dehydratase small subunit
MNTSNNLSLHSLTGITKVFGDNINTDLIMPSQYLDNPDPNYFSKFVMSGINPNFVKEIKDVRNEYDLSIILVAGKNFGSGSSREQAPQGLKHAGISVVLAESFNTILLRNAVNIGLPIAIIPNILNQVKDNFHLELNLKKGVLQILKPMALKIAFPPLEPFLLRRLEHGGLLPELKNFVKMKP